MALHALSVDSCSCARAHVHVYACARTVTDSINVRESSAASNNDHEDIRSVLLPENVALQSTGEPTTYHNRPKQQRQQEKQHKKQQDRRSILGLRHSQIQPVNPPLCQPTRKRGGIRTPPPSAPGRSSFIPCKKIKPNEAKSTPAGLHVVSSVRTIKRHRSTEGRRGRPPATLP